MELIKNTEVTQTLIRFCIGILTFVFISSGIDSGYFNTNYQTLYYLSTFYFSYTFINFLTILWVPESTIRRYMGLLFDISNATFSSYLTGGINSVFVLIYIWIYIGYGARYGKQFLIAAVIMTLIGYNILIITEDAWNKWTLDTIAYLLLIATLPIYFYSMQKRLQTAVAQAYQANRSKTDFLSTMTHQIRTPIGGVVGMIDLLNNTKLEPQQKQYLQALSQSSNALQEIIEDIIDFSHIEQGRIKFNQKSFDVRALINGLVHSLATLAHEKKLEINCFVSKDFPDFIFSDNQRLRQLLSNLIRYAIENCTSQGVYIIADTKTNTKGSLLNCRIEIRFHNTLRNGPSDQFSLPASDAALALRVGSQLTRLMNGSFDIFYPEDHTPAFLLKFNWELDREKHQEKTALFSDRRALIYEEDKTNRQVLEEYCNQMGIETYTTDGKDNLIAHILWSKKKNKLFDVIILCENLKLNSTFELLPRIRHEANYQAPIIYATYLQSIGQIETSAMKDIQETLTKPVSLEELEKTLLAIFYDTKAISKKERKPSKACQILLAEDSEINASIIYNHLTDLGHSVDIATDGNTALYAMHKHHYDVVFMDIQMPNMDGIEATRQWRKLETGNSKLPIIALTAKATSNDKKQCLDAGMNNFLTKPVSSSQLSEILQQYL